MYHLLLEEQVMGMQLVTPSFSLSRLSSKPGEACAPVQLAHTVINHFPLCDFIEVDTRSDARVPYIFLMDYLYCRLPFAFHSPSLYYH